MTTVTWLRQWRKLKWKWVLHLSCHVWNFLGTMTCFLKFGHAWFVLQVLLRMLPAYYNNFRDQQNTLLTKYYGLHCVKLNGPIQKKVHFFMTSVNKRISVNKKLYNIINMASFFLFKLLIYFMFYKLWIFGINLTSVWV